MEAVPVGVPRTCSRIWMHLSFDSRLCEDVTLDVRPLLEEQVHWNCAVSLCDVSGHGIVFQENRVARDVCGAS